MEHQFRTRGIYRPNAQRLSISLAPLVAQRSLLFRVKADLATKTSYGQLTPTTDESDFESPGLFALTASACLVSAVLTLASAAVSAASVYSQDSWRGAHSPLAPLLRPPVDTRRHAVAFSPSVQYSDFADEKDGEVRIPECELTEVPLESANVSEAARPAEPESTTTAPEPDSRTAERLPVPRETALPPSMLEDEKEAGGKLKKKKAPGEPDGAPKPTRGFSRVMGRLSLQPSKKELAAAQKRQTAMTISHPMPALPAFAFADLKPISVADYRLPALKTPGPIRMSFIVGASAQTPAPAPAARAPAPAPAPPPSAAAAVPEISAPAIPAAYAERDARAAERQRLLRAAAPGTPSWRTRSLTPPPPLTPVRAPATAAAADSNANAPKKKGHRRYRSSPAVLQFDFHGWDEESAPPLPPLPAFVPVPVKLAPAPPPRSAMRPRAQSVVGKAPGARAVAPPFPPPRARYGSV